MKENGNKRVVFQRTPKMSTYLLAIVVGYFDDPVEKEDANGVLIRVFTPMGKRHQGKYALEVYMIIILMFKLVGDTIIILNLS